MTEQQEIDYTTPRNELEVYQKKPTDYYKEDIAQFCFTEFHIMQHIREVIHDMNLFIRTGTHFVFKHRKEENNERF